MNQRYSSVKTSNNLTKNKNLSAEFNIPALRPSSGVRKVSQIGPAAQKKIVKSVFDKFQLETKTPVKNLTTSLNDFKRNTSPKLVQPFSVSRKLESKPILRSPIGKLDSKPSLKPSTTGKFGSVVSPKSPSRLFKQRLESKQQLVTLSPEDIQLLTSKFEALSAIIIRLATSDSPISVRSLETLLTKEVTNCLGSAINSAKFAEGFVRETRRLLYGLHCKFEEGQVNTQLIKGAKRPFLTANSVATACYKDRYLKELVMNTLQEVCSVVDRAQDVSAVSKQRAGGALRDLVRAEAGLEPEVFQRVEKGIEQLQKSASHNRQEVESASREIDQLISDHQLRQEYVVIPKLSKEVVNDNKGTADIVDQDSSYKVLTNENILVNKNKFSTNNSLSERQNSENTENCLGVGDEHQTLEKTNNPLLFSDPIQTIRPKIDKIVQEEISRAQEKTRDILDRIMVSSLEDPQDESVHSIISESSVCEDTDDEIDVKETLLFLEALKADATHNLVNKCTISSHCSLLGASEEDVRDKENPHLPSNGRNVRLIPNTDEQYKFGNKDEIIGPTLEKRSSWVESEVLSYKLCHENSMPTIAEETNDDVCFDENKCNENMMRHVKSVWWDEDKTEAQEIVKQIKNSLNAFDRPKKDSEAVSESNQISDTHPKNHVKNLSEFYESGDDFTVEEMSHILKNISKKVDHLTLSKGKGGANFCDVYSPLTNAQQTDLINTLSLLENTLDGSFLPDSGSNSSTRGYQPYDKNSFAATKQKLSGTFNMISDMLGRAPTDLQKQPISALAPPESLMKTLALLAASGIFRDCFITGILEVHKRSKDESLTDNNLSNDKETPIGNDLEMLCTRPSKDLEMLCSRPSKDLEMLCTRPSKDLEIVKPVSLETQQSSREIFPVNLSTGVKSVNHVNKLNLAFKRFENKMKNCDDVNLSTLNYEHYLRLSTAVMTVKNVSDMFVFFSAVLNDIPDRMKSENLTSLNPPPSLLKALDILYNAEDGECFTELQKNSSFNSLTVQSVSNLFLTLSKAFEDLPERVKHSNVLELEPPQSLLTAINLLTSLPFNCAPDSKSEEELERAIIGDCRSDESQEYFYDALDTSSHH